MLRLLTVLIAAAAATSAIAASPTTQTERFLLPITVSSSSGAFQTRWSTEASIYIDVAPNVSQYVFPLDGCDPPECGGGGPTSRTILPLGFFATPGGTPHGSILYVERAIADHVFVSLRLRSSAGSPPVPLPVVRERDFYDGRFHILGVPDASATRRLTLRIYALEAAAPPAVTVRVYGGYPETLLHQAVVQLGVVQRYWANAVISVPVRPAEGEETIGAALGSANGLLRFEIEGPPSAPPLWAMVSVTENATQQVTIYTPR